MWVRWKKLRAKITGISSLAGTEPEILLGGNLSPLATYVIKNTLAIGGLIQNNTILDHDRRTDRLLFSDFTVRLAGAVGSVYNEERALLKMRMYEAIMTRKGTNTPRPMTATAYE